MRPSPSPSQPRSPAHRSTSGRRPRPVYPSGIAECALVATLVLTAAGAVVIDLVVPSFRIVSAWLVLIAGTALVAHVAQRLGAFGELERLLLLFNRSPLVHMREATDPTVEGARHRQPPQHTDHQTPAQT